MGGWWWWWGEGGVGGGQVFTSSGDLSSRHPSRTRSVQTLLEKSCFYRLQLGRPAICVVSAATPSATSSFHPLVTASQPLRFGRLPTKESTSSRELFSQEAVNKELKCFGFRFWWPQFSSKVEEYSPSIMCEPVEICPCLQATPCAHFNSISRHA